MLNKPVKKNAKINSCNKIQPAYSTKNLVFRTVEIKKYWKCVYKVGFAEAHICNKKPVQ